MGGSMIPEGVTEGIATLNSDVLIIGGAMFLVVLTVVAFAYFKRVAR